MKQGQFYFIKDSYYDKFDQDGTMMDSKGNLHERPCFYAFNDSKYNDIFWCIPISSKVEKFKDIVQHKLAKQVERGITSPKCSTIRFGKVMGRERAFLIQNMFPITQPYISDVYIDKNTKKPITIEHRTERDIVKNAKDVLKLVSHGYKSLVFSDILKIRDALIAENASLLQEKEKTKPEAALDALFGFTCREPDEDLSL